MESLSLEEENIIKDVRKLFRSENQKKSRLIPQLKT